jgi:hypothetical protein
MENIKLIFCENSGTSELQAYVNSENNLYIQIENFDCMTPFYIELDLETAEAFLKHLTNEIDNIKLNLL